MLLVAGNMLLVRPTCCRHHVAALCPFLVTCDVHTWVGWKYVENFFLAKMLQKYTNQLWFDGSSYYQKYCHNPRVVMHIRSIHEHVVGVMINSLQGTYGPINISVACFCLFAKLPTYWVLLSIHTGVNCKEQQHSRLHAILKFKFSGVMSHCTDTVVNRDFGQDFVMEIMSAICHGRTVCALLFRQIIVSKYRRPSPFSVV